MAARQNSKSAEKQPKRPLYTPSERVRRDTTVWTLVQGILAPLQFLVFLVSLAFVIRALLTGAGYDLATGSVVLKTAILYIIMITGAIWEKVVFGKYLFVESFFWEDVFSMAVIALHTAYLAALLGGWLSPTALLWLALAAYGAYVINAVQFLLKLRAARRQSDATQTPLMPESNGVAA
ncbi:MAG: 2-vinyl bacteriochlorophyllide hydratase [Pseudomonadota bacterium]